MSDYKESVKALQTTLKNAGVYKGAVDGIAGKLTIEAMELFCCRTTEDMKAAGRIGTGFALDERSTKNLVEVKPELVRVVKLASEKCKTKFVVIEGKRSLIRQKELMKKGATRTLKSRHLTGDAVDIVPLINGAVSWKVEDYYPLAEAMAEAATALGVRVRWGGVWQVITGKSGSPAEWIKAYRADGGKFIDCPHFELPAA